MGNAEFNLPDSSSQAKMCPQIEELKKKPEEFIMYKAIQILHLNMPDLIRVKTDDERRDKKIEISSDLKQLYVELLDYYKKQGLSNEDISKNIKRFSEQLFISYFKDTSVIRADEENLSDSEKYNMVQEALFIIDFTSPNFLEEHGLVEKPKLDTLNLRDFTFKKTSSNP